MAKPRLDLKKELEARILELTDVVAKKSRHSPQTAFYRAKREFAHFHGPREIDIRLTKAKIKLLKPDYRIEVAYPPKDWIVVHFEEEDDLGFVFGLAEAAWKASAYLKIGSTAASRKIHGPSYSD